MIIVWTKAIQKVESFNMVFANHIPLLSAIANPRLCHWSFFSFKEKNAVYLFAFTCSRIIKRLQEIAIRCGDDCVRNQCFSDIRCSGAIRYRNEV